LIRHHHNGHDAKAARAASRRAPPVRDDLPAELPIREEELDLLAAQFGDILRAITAMDR
jgi:hypothetical protein